MDFNNQNNDSHDSNKRELDFNKKKREDYEHLMTESSTKLDGYWDKSNPIVKIILLILGVIIIIGSVYYITTYLGSR